MTESSDTTGTPTTTTNGAAPKKVSMLDTLHKAWEEAGKKEPPEKKSREMIATYRKAVDAAKVADDASKAAQVVVDDAAKAIVAAHGREFDLVLDGEKYVPASYEAKVYFRRVAAVVKKTLGA